MQSRLPFTDNDVLQTYAREMKRKTRLLDEVIETYSRAEEVKFYSHKEVKQLKTMLTETKQPQFFSAQEITQFQKQLQQPYTTPSTDDAKKFKDLLTQNTHTPLHSHKDVEQIKKTLHLDGIAQTKVKSPEDLQALLVEGSIKKIYEANLSPPAAVSYPQSTTSNLFQSFLNTQPPERIDLSLPRSEFPPIEEIIEKTVTKQKAERIALMVKAEGTMKNSVFYFEKCHDKYKFYGAIPAKKAEHSCTNLNALLDIRNIFHCTNSFFFYVEDLEKLMRKTDLFKITPTELDAATIALENEAQSNLFKKRKNRVVSKLSKVQKTDEITSPSALNTSDEIDLEMGDINAGLLQLRSQMQANPETTDNQEIDWIYPHP